MGAKKGKYYLHQDSLGTQEDLQGILNKIGEYPKSLPITKISRKKALVEVLTIHSELAFMNSKDRASNIPDLNPVLDSRQNERMIQESLKWAIKWVFDYCNDKNAKSVVPSRKEIIRMLTFAYKYDLIRDVLYSASRGGYSIKLTDNKIEFIPAKTNHTFLAYNSWRQAYRERIQINGIRSNGIEAIKEVQFGDFSMPESWNLGKYTLQEYIKFSVSLEEMLYRWIKNHAIKNRAIVVGKYRSNELIKVYHKNWWVEQISKASRLAKSTVEDIIVDLSYSDIKDADPAYQFFVPLSDTELALSACFVGGFVRPERNLMTLLPKMEENMFHQLSNDCESQQIELIKQSINNKNVIVGEKRTKAQETRPGMDVLFLDSETGQLLIVELKWTASPSSTSEMYKVDEKVEKGLKQLQEAHEYVVQHTNSLLYEYFGSSYKGKQSKDYEYCVVVNESIGTGEHCDSYAPVITLDHLIELLDKGVGYVIDTLRNKNYRVPPEYYSEVPMNFELLGYDVQCSGTELKGVWLDKTLPPRKRGLRKTSG